MDINRVRYFHVFADTGSMVRAAEILHLSQPALSKAIKTLETEIGVKLVEPDGRGLRLTESGTRFRIKTSELLKDWLNIPKLFTHGIEKPTTRFGSFEVFTTYFLSHLSLSLNLEGLEVHEFGPGKLEKNIAEGTLDFGITYLPVPNPGVRFVEITRIKMGTFGVGEKFASRDFHTLPFAIPLVPTDGTPTKMIGLDGWPDHRFERNVKYRVTLMESALELCRKGLCVGYFPEFVVQLQNEDLRTARKLVEVRSPLPSKERLQSVFLILPKNTSENSLHRDIAKCLRSLN